MGLYKMTMRFSYIFLVFYLSTVATQDDNNIFNTRRRIVTISCIASEIESNTGPTSQFCVLPSIFRSNFW